MLWKRGCVLGLQVCGLGFGLEGCGLGLGGCGLVNIAGGHTLGNLLSGSVFVIALIKKAEIYLHTKFRWDISFHGWDKTTSGFGKRTAAKLELYFRFRFWPSLRHQRVILHRLPNFVKIELPSAELWRHIDFSRWRPAAILGLSWIILDHPRSAIVGLSLIRERVKFKVACLVRQSLSGQVPLYLADDWCLVSDSIRRSLRSADVPTCVVPRTLSSYGDRTFAAAGPRLWNCLPVQLCNPHITYRDCSDDSWRDTFLGKHERGAVWLLICGALQ